VSFHSYTNPVFLSLIHFLLLVYIFPIFHTVISFLHKPFLSQLDPFLSISVHISYLPHCHFFPTQTLSFSAWSISFYYCTYFLSSTLSFLSYTNPLFLSLIHFLLLVYIFPIFHTVISFLHEPCLPQLDPFPSISVHISYFHIVISFLHKPYLSQLDPFPSISVHISYLPQCHFFPTQTLYFSAGSISFY
jgi:hypothetical protein